MTEHTELPDDPVSNPEQFVDAKEREIAGQVGHRTRDEDDTDKPAFEQDVDPDDTSAEQGGHTAQEPPV